MSYDEIVKLIIEVLEKYFEALGNPVQINEETVLFGNEAVLDSMGLVNIIIDIESRLMDFGVDISLTSESAMSRSRSPFRTAKTLGAYIDEELAR